MINYEVGGKLKFNKKHPFICNDVEYLITDVFDKNIYVECKDKNSISMPKSYLLYCSNDFIYIPPAKECKSCKGRGHIIDPEREAARLAQMGYSVAGCIYVKDCPECTKPKQEERPQPKFKVGDKVRILSDVTWYVDMIKSGYITSAIGKVGTVKHVLDDPIAYDVFDLPRSCHLPATPDGLFYAEDQLKKLIPLKHGNLKHGMSITYTGETNNKWINLHDYNLVGDSGVWEIYCIQGHYTPYWEIIDFMLVEPKEEPIDDVIITRAGLPDNVSKIMEQMLDQVRERAEHRRSCDAYGAALQEILYEPLLKEQRLKDTIKLINEGRIKLAPHNDMLDAMRYLLNQVEKMSKPKKTKEQIRDIVIEELEAKGFESCGILGSRFKKNGLHAVFYSYFMQLKNYDQNINYKIPYNEHKSINKFLAKVDELLKPKEATCKVIGSLSELLAREKATKAQEALDKLNPHWSKDDKPKFTKGQKIRYIGSGSSMEPLKIIPNEIVTFNNYFLYNHEQLVIEGWFFRDRPILFDTKDFEPVEYVSFSKALEWLKEGYTINRSSNTGKAVKLNNGIVTDMSMESPVGIYYDAVLANDWYWVEKPEGK